MVNTYLLEVLKFFLIKEVGHVEVFMMSEFLSESNIKMFCNLVQGVFQVALKMRFCRNTVFKYGENAKCFTKYYTRLPFILNKSH